MVHIILKTISGIKNDIDIDDSSTVEEYVSTIKEILGYGDDIPDIKLIHVGKVIDKTLKWSHYEIKDGDTIIVMKQKQKQTPIVQENTPVAQVSQAQNNPLPDTSSAEIPQTQYNNVPETPLNPVQQFWRQIAPSEETTPMYSVEQIHIVVPTIFSFLMQNPQMMMLIITSPSAITSSLMNQAFRTLLRQLLEQSNSLINSVRTGTNANIVINVPPVTEQNNEIIENNVDSTINQNIGMINQVNNGNEVESNYELEINQLMEITKAPYDMCKQVFLSSGNNLAIAASIIFQMFDSDDNFNN